jgi:integrase
VRAFEDKLAADLSPAMVRKARVGLGALLNDAQERGLVGQNVVRSLRSRRRRGKDGPAARQKGKLQAGVDIPSPDEIRAIIAALDPSSPARPLLLTAIFTGLRISELRGLCWDDVDLKRGELTVRQRADRYNAMGKPKSEAGHRVIPLPPMLVSALRAWKLACPIGERGLAFPAKDGGIQNYQTITRHALDPALIAAGIPGKYGWHSLRHFYASWCINRKVDGGLELPPKLVQQRMGHASIAMTMDVYGHLFPRGDDGAELAAAEKAFLG